MKKKAAKKTTKRKTPPHPYVLPKTAAQLGIDCAVCHAPAVWFDFGRGQRDHRSGFVCDNEPAVGNREQLLTQAGAA
jgi:hypothetical protein